MAVDHFAFRFDNAFRFPLLALGVTERRSGVWLDDELLTVRFGWLGLATPLSNIVDVQITGPYRWFKVIGPRMSLADRGVSFGTSTRAGVCMRFRDSVPALYGSLQRHPGCTVTVTAPETLAAALGRRLAA